jgi:hypothetical protein
MSLRGCLKSNFQMIFCQIRGSLHSPTSELIIPSQVLRNCRKGVETRWQTSDLLLEDEGIVQLTNSKEVTKVIVRA